MADDKDREPKRPEDQPDRDKIENDPAVERGERVNTAKHIARGGKTSGHVPGATETKPAR